MKDIILINGLIASGKNTVGRMLVDTLIAAGYKATFFDLDQEVFHLDPLDEVNSEEKRRETWLSARKNLAMNVTKVFNTGNEVAIIAGPFFYHNEIVGLTNYLPDDCIVYLFTLAATISVRSQRDSERTHSNTQEKLVEQEKIVLQQPPTALGVTVDNNGNVEETVRIILDLYEKREGSIDRSEVS